jgi:hypothetical protein
VAANAACTLSSNTYTVRVKPIPTITLSSGDASQCIIMDQDAAIIPIVYTASAGATITMTGSLPQGVTGAVDGASYTISGTPTETGTFGYSLTAAVSGCTSTAVAGTIWVHSWVTPPADAVTTQLWCIGPQLWSDRIVQEPTGCGKLECLNANEYSREANYKVSDDHTYYAGQCAMAAQYTLCGSSWRYPSNVDYRTLMGNTSGAYLAQTWGLGGAVIGCDVVNAGSYGYLMGTQKTSIDMDLFLWSEAGMQVTSSGKYLGMEFRCVRGL